jgi:hypothetical protein
MYFVLIIFIWIFLSFGTNHLSFHYFLWGNSPWYTSALDYEHVSGTNYARKRRHHCITYFRHFLPPAPPPKNVPYSQLHFLHLENNIRSNINKYGNTIHQEDILKKEGSSFIHVADRAAASLFLLLPRARFFLGLLFGPEDGSKICVRNVRWRSTNYTAL